MLAIVEPRLWARVCWAACHADAAVSVLASVLWSGYRQSAATPDSAPDLASGLKATRPDGDAAAQE